jgi:glycosyltransferase involved in cell wall biosynthesis
MIDSNYIPLVTVGIPTYNRPIGLEKTLECIVNQTYKNIHILISDNCSTDTEVVEVMKKYAAADNRIKFIVQKENLSIVPNFQYLLDNAIGDYFMWAADDDQWDLNFIEVCVKAMNEDNEVVLAIPDVKIVQLDGAIRMSKLNRSFMQKSLYSRSFNFVKSEMENKFFLYGLYRTASVKNIIFNNSWGGEHLFLFENITKGKFLYLKGQSALHYFAGGSSTSTDKIRKAFNIKSKFYFFDAYIFRFMTFQFGFKHLSLFKKCALFITNAMGLLANENYLLYYILIKKPLKALF